MSTAKFSFFKKGIQQTKPDLDITLDSAIKKIESEQYKETVEQLRITKDKPTRQVLKRQLGYFTFSGTFKKRNASSLIKHSSLICVDLDDLDQHPKRSSDPNYQSVNSIKKMLSADQYVVIMFVSPSGNGLKILFHIDGDKHLESFKGLQHYFADQYDLEVDPSGKDVSRACYLSYDPDIYVNREPKKFTLIVEGDLSVDYETGEIIDSPADTLDALDGKTKKKFDKAVYVVEQIERDEIDITSDYDTWVQVGMALATFGEVARDLYDRISRFHPSYNPREVHYKFTDYLKNSKFTSPAKLFSVAKDFGINTSLPKTAAPAVAEGANVNPAELIYEMPDDSTPTDAIKAQAIQYGFIEYKNVIYIAQFNRSENMTKVQFKGISNYVLRPLFLILSKADPKRLFEIVNIHGHKSVIDMPTKNFVSVQAFCEVVESQGNYLMSMSKSEFHKMKTKWYDNTKNAEEIITLGWHRDGFYCFANGIFYDRKFHGIDEYGMISRTTIDDESQEQTKHYFIPAMSEIYKDEESQYESEKKFVYIQSKTKFKDWAALFATVHKHNNNGMIAMSWYLASLYRDFIYNRFKFFPHLFGFGPPGTGKSTLGWSISYMFGIERKPFNLNAGTAPGFYRTFAQVKNGVVWFDEYSNTIDPKRIQDLKNAYDGGGHVKGDMNSGGNSNRTVTTPIHSASYISGQELPIADNALFKRCILEEFHQSEYSDQEVADAVKLRALEEKSLSAITAHLTSFRELIEEQYNPTFDKVMKELKAALVKEPNIEDRILQNMCICITMYKVLENELPWPFTWPQLLGAAAQSIINQNRMISKAKETNQFWDTIQYLYTAGLIQEGTDFVIKPDMAKIKIRVDRKSTSERVFEQPTTLFVFTLSRMHALYRKALREQGDSKGMDKQSLRHYLQHSNGYIGAVNKINYGNNTTSGDVIEYSVLEDMGYDFSKPVAKMQADSDDDLTPADTSNGGPVPF